VERLKQAYSEKPILQRGEDLFLESWYTKLRRLLQHFNKVIKV